MITFVSLSQIYLSDYLIENSKDHIGEKIDPAKLSELIGMPELTASPLPSVLIFWSVSCAPCLKKLKNLPDIGLGAADGARRIIPINTDAETSIENAKTVLSEFLPKQPFYHDRGRNLVTQLEIDYLPTNIYLAADGTIEKIAVGEK